MLNYKAVAIQIVLYKAYRIYVSGYTRNCDTNTILSIMKTQTSRLFYCISLYIV